MARLTRTLSATEIEKAKSDVKTKFLFDGGGLYLEITPKGKKLWRFKYRIAGKPKLLSFGSYPDDQPETCRQCGTRTDFIDLSKETQLHRCSNCQFTYWLEDGTVPCVKCSSIDVMEDVCDDLLIDIPSVWFKTCGTLYHRDEEIIVGNINPLYVLRNCYE